MRRVHAREHRRPGGPLHGRRRRRRARRRAGAARRSQVIRCDNGPESLLPPSATGVVSPARGRSSSSLAAPGRHPGPRASTARPATSSSPAKSSAPSWKPACSTTTGRTPDAMYAGVCKLCAVRCGSMRLGATRNTRSEFHGDILQTHALALGYVALLGNLAWFMEVSTAGHGGNWSATPMTSPILPETGPSAGRRAWRRERRRCGSGLATEPAATPVEL